MIRSSAVTGLVILVGACGLTAQTSQPVGYPDAPELLAQVQDERIREASGVVASRRNPGCYYVHNDSGDEPRVFLIDRNGRTRLTIHFRATRAIDYEDIALAPGQEAGTFDVCVADIGDNDEKRPDVTIYRFPELELPGQDGATVEAEPVAYMGRYPDGPANAEAFAVHPRTGDGYIFTKRRDGRSVVYKLAAPWDAKRVTVLRKLRALELPSAMPLARIVTAADISPDGGRLALRCYVDGWEWRLPVGTSDADFERILSTTPIRLPLAPEPQGEAVCYAADGQSLLTISEGVSPPLWELGSASASSRPTTRP